MRRAGEEYPLDKLIYMEMEQFRFCLKINVIVILNQYVCMNTKMHNDLPKSEIRMELAESFYIKSYIEVY